MHFLTLEELVHYFYAAREPKICFVVLMVAQAVLTENTQKNVQTVLDRLSKAAPRVQLGSEGRVQREHRVDHIVHRLIEAAAQPERLCQMPPTWMPWL